MTLDALPLVREISPIPDVEEVLLRLSAHPHCLFFDSARREATLGRYSFLMCDPFDFFTAPADGSDALGELQQRLESFRSETLSELPPFQGGAAGLLSYDLGRSLERLASPRFDEFQLPAAAVGLYDVLLAIDHLQGRAWIISQGLPETEPARRRHRAAERLEQFTAWLSEPRRQRVAHTNRYSSTLEADQLAPQHAVRGMTGLTSNFAPAEYLTAIARGIEYIRAGDIFQVNLAQRLLYPMQDDAVSLYLRLRQRNPATFAGYFDAGDFYVASASPERFVSVQRGEAEARPIKGTRQRTFRPEADLYSGDELQQSEKDRAENVMIVDLLRNDLSRVCQTDSVRVTQLCELETYEFVQHLVSAVRGRLRGDRTNVDLLRAAFPGGSITGAPKVRAMQIIAEIEPTARGPYCGSLGYWGFDGTMDTSILIRTLTGSRGWWQAPVGGGIVVQSNPQAEYEETWHKAEGMLRALCP